VGGRAGGSSRRRSRCGTFGATTGTCSTRRAPPVGRRGLWRHEDLFSAPSGAARSAARAPSPTLPRWPRLLPPGAPATCPPARSPTARPLERAHRPPGRRDRRVPPGRRPRRRPPARRGGGRGRHVPRGRGRRLRATHPRGARGPVRPRADDVAQRHPLRWGVPGSGDEGRPAPAPPLGDRRRRLRLVGDGWAGPVGDVPRRAGHGRQPVRMGADSVVLDDDHRPLPPGSGRVGWLARRGRLPVGYVGDPEATRRTSSRSTASAGPSPGTGPSRRPTARSSCTAEAPRRSTPGARRCRPRRSRRPCEPTPAVLDAVVVGVQDERWGEVVAAVVAVRPGASVSVERWRSAAGGPSPPTSCRGAWSWSHEVVRSPSGKPDLRWPGRPPRVSRRQPPRAAGGRAHSDPWAR
jgi:hypothetical protein